MTDTEIMCALIGQVASAANGRSEREVKTLITRPMWNAFLRSIGAKENAVPTEWRGIHRTIRVYGSETIVIESDEMASVSFPL